MDLFLSGGRSESTAFNRRPTLTPGPNRRKPLSDSDFLENRWGHDWTQIKPSEKQQFRLCSNHLEPQSGWGQSWFPINNTVAGTPAVRPKIIKNSKEPLQAL